MAAARDKSTALRREEDRAAERILREVDATSRPSIRFSERQAFLNDVLEGLSGIRKTLPCKYFYDEIGSGLFEEICGLEEYYPTRTETAILRQSAKAITSLWPEGTALIEYGSGSSIKTRILLAESHRLGAYVPVDISCEHLRKSARSLAAEHPGLAVLPVCADYTRDFPMPDEARRAEQRAVFFPGSTIGNFRPFEAVRFLARIRRVVGAGGSLLIGVDLVKDPDVLRAAYNDARGVTARFNLNLLARINRELGGDFDLSGFEHIASYEPGRGRIVMRLVSRRAQIVCIDNTIVTFRAGESITTEYSYKYTLERFAAIAGRASFDVERVWTDPSRHFSVQLLRARPRKGVAIHVPLRGGA